MGDDHFLQAKENLKHNFSLSEIDTNIEFLSQFSGLNPNSHQENFHGLMGFIPNYEYLFPQIAEFPGNIESHLKEVFTNDEDNPVGPTSNGSSIILNSNGENNNNNNNKKKKKRKERDDVSTPETSSANSSALVMSRNETNRKKNISGRGKRVKGNEKEDEKSKEVVHVRAKRGQATDSHSLAERVRRGKINERLRCLQDIVPGCDKSMGMAVMLDEIINYVQSLQNQVEFLSMKLTAASTFHDFNSDTNTLETMQRAKTLEQLKIQNTANQGTSSMQLSPLDLNFGYLHQLPPNRF